MQKQGMTILRDRGTAVTYAVIKGLTQNFQKLFFLARERCAVGNFLLYHGW